MNQKIMKKYMFIFLKKISEITQKILLKEYLLILKINYGRSD
jgi:hypothetical protein